MDIANTPVIGWTRIEERVKKGKTVTTKQSFEVRAWEVAALAFVGATFYWLYQNPNTAGQGQLSSNPAAWFFGGPVGAWIWGSVTGK